MKNFILSIDQGTTGTTALLIDAKNFELIDKVNQEFTQHFPKPSWVEHDLAEIWKSVENTTKEVLKKNSVSGDQIKAIGITNQRETTCAFNKKGHPLAKAIVWQDRRTHEYCKKNTDAYKKLKKKTGLPLDPYFSGTKMNWLLTNNKEVSSAAKSDDLCLGTIDSFLLYKMTDHKVFATEASNASRTLLMDLDTTDWCDELLRFFEVKKEFLPRINDSFTHFGETKNLNFLPDGIPISCILGDQQAALFGQAGYKAGDLKCTYGTGAFILLNTGEEKTYSRNGLLTTVAYKKDNKTCYALEGASYIAGAAVQWLRDNLNMIEDAPSVEKLARSIEDFSQMEHLLFMPFFTGIASPYWNSEAKASILGITRDTNKNHIARACLDGIALSINDSIQALIADSPESVAEIRVDGGASLNDLLCEIQASFSQKKIIRPKVIETTAYGVALGAIVGLGEIELSKVKDLWKEDKEFNPSNEDYFKTKSHQWTETIKKIY
ncbi:MAG: glycerol kinase [Halobacteriovoraceae bacterium]|nr:glycerol kinase [Halobacteriovoraceae bacterium]|tara:strand:- start:15302 stop:16780 length:1479 start_codon:yes stop_codon:yes gene_type:complete